MTIPKALVVEYDEKTQQAIDEILAALGHEYDTVTCLIEARKALAGNGYTYVLAGHELPGRSGGSPRRQNIENLLDDLSRIKGDRRPPVIVLFSPMPEVDEEDRVRWAADLRTRGATTFVCKPFRSSGRTLDRVIKKVLSALDGDAQHETPQVRGPAHEADQDGDGAGQWLTVTDAAELLIRDVPNLDLAKARSRISTAAGRKEFTFTGARKDRRIEPNSFAAWRLKQRDRDLDGEDDG
jgi:DNA-binding response OmpR family regulator